MQRFAKISYLLIPMALILFSPSLWAEPSNSKPVSFIREVAPILVSQCQACHGPKTSEGNYRLDTFQLMMQPGDSGAASITAGDLENSDLHRLITADDSEERMPNNGGQLTDSEIHTIEAWILQGAKFDGQDVAGSLRDQIPRDIPHPAAPDVYPTAIPVTAMTFTTDGNQLLVGGYHELLVWDSVTGTLITRVGNNPQRTFGMAFSPDGSWLALAGGTPGVSGEVRLIPWHGGPNKDAQPKILATQEDVFFDVAFRADGQQLAAGGADGSLRVFEVGTGKQIINIESHADWVTDVCFSPDGKTIATASRDKTAKVFDAVTGALLATHSEHNAPVRAVAIAPDSKTVLSAGGKQIHVWNIEDTKTAGEMAGFENDVYSLLARGESVVATSADRTARQFKLADRSLIRTLKEHPGWVLTLAWHEPSQRVSTGCLDGTVTVWSLEDGAMVKQFLAIPTKVGTPP